MGNEYSDDAVDEMVELVASGALYNAPEANKVSAAAGNWEQAFGVPATVDDVAYVKEIARLFEADLAAGKDCAHFDGVFDFIAQDFNSDRGRTEYVFGGSGLAWIEPDLALRLLSCFD